MPCQCTQETIQYPHTGHVGRLKFETPLSHPQLFEMEDTISYLQYILFESFFSHTFSQLNQIYFYRGMVDSLKDLVLKEFARFPGKHISEIKFNKALHILEKSDGRYKNHDVLVQEMINHVTNAGRMTDDAVKYTLVDPQSTYLSLKNSKVSRDYVISVVSRCHMLETIILDGCLQVDDMVINHILKTCTNIRHLSINNCRKITDDTLTSLAHKISNHNSQINTILIGGDFNITQLGLESFFNAQLIPKLIEINISGLTLSPKIISNILQYGENIEVLGFSYATSFVINECILTHLVKKFGKTLKRLDIAWLGAVNNRVAPGTVYDIDLVGYDLEVPAELMENTNSPTIGVTDLSLEFLQLLCHSCPKLTTLDFCGLKCFTIASIQRFIEYRASLVSLLIFTIFRNNSTVLLLIASHLLSIHVLSSSYRLKVMLLHLLYLLTITCLFNILISNF